MGGLGWILGGSIDEREMSVGKWDISRLLFSYPNKTGAIFTMEMQFCMGYKSKKRFDPLFSSQATNLDPLPSFPIQQPLNSGQTRGETCQGGGSGGVSKREKRREETGFRRWPVIYSGSPVLFSPSFRVRTNARSPAAAVCGARFR